MVQFQMLGGQAKGSIANAAEFPWVIGRAADADWRIEAPGVWNHHLQILFDRKEGFRVETLQEGQLHVNGQPVQRSQLRNGDVLEFGSIKIQFWLAQVPQKNLRPREVLTWLALAFLALFQVALVYSLIR